MFPVCLVTVLLLTLLVVSKASAGVMELFPPQNVTKKSTADYLEESIRMGWQVVGSGVDPSKDRLAL